MAVVASRHYPGTAPQYEAVSLDFSNDVLAVGHYVEVKLGSSDCLSLTEVEVFGYQITPPPSNIAQGEAVTASQSSTCHGGSASRAIDGNTNGEWGGNSVQHTCDEVNPWWMVDLGSSNQHTISHIEIYNRNANMDRMTNSDIQILNDEGTVVSSQTIEQGDIQSVYTFVFGNVVGRYVRVQKNVFGALNIAEVKVMGVSEVEVAAPTTSPPTSPPPPCAGICPGSYPYGCATNLQGKVAYGCMPSGGCNYLEEGQDYPHDGFCTYKGTVSLPETYSPSISPIVATLAPSKQPTPKPIAPQVTHCGCSACTDTVWNTPVTDGAGTHSCGSRITWLQSFEGGSKSESAACTQVGNEFGLDQCGPACNPELCDAILEEPDPEKLIWSDEFNADGTPDPTKWDYDLGDGCPTLCSWGNQEEAFYTSSPGNVNVSNGILQITAKKESGFTRPYTSSRMVTRGLHSFKYGRIQFRASLANCKARGTWPALWMLPEDKVYGAWPNSGEIDVMESVGHESNLFHQTVHTTTYNGMIGNHKGKRVSRNKDDFHTFEIDWKEDIIQFAVDGQVYFKYYRSGDSNVWPFDQRFHLIMNVAVGGTWGGVNGVDGAAFEGEGQTMEVDWIRVYGDATPSPSKQPTESPSKEVTTLSPSTRPTASPSRPPSANPTTSLPSSQPTTTPSKLPTISPTTKQPSLIPTSNPSSNPIQTPTISPSRTPILAPVDTSAPTKALINLARVTGATAQQSSAYYGMGANRAIDGVKTNGSNNVPTTHTQCSDSPSPWWRVYFGEGEIKTVKVYNRNDCVSPCGCVQHTRVVKFLVYCLTHPIDCVYSSPRLLLYSAGIA